MVKVSKWVENNLEATTRILLGKKITELELHDAVTNQRLLLSDYFYKNLRSKEPQILNWRVLYKNQYGKFKRFVVKQRPLFVRNKVVGFLLTLKYPPKTLQVWFCSIRVPYPYNPSRINTLWGSNWIFGDWIPWF